MAFCDFEFSSFKPAGIKVSFILQTIGEHIRKKRLEQGLLQEDVAKMIGVTTDCITNWENNRGIPQIQFMPAIIKFLGFIPLEIEADDLGGQILFFRYQLGLSYKKLGKLIRVNGSSISCWENRKSIPRKANIEKLNNILFQNEKLE